MQPIIINPLKHVISTLFMESMSMSISGKSEFNSKFRLHRKFWMTSQVKNRCNKLSIELSWHRTQECDWTWKSSWEVSLQYWVCLGARAKRRTYVWVAHIISISTTFGELLAQMEPHESRPFTRICGIIPWKILRVIVISYMSLIEFQAKIIQLSGCNDW